ncbi:serine/threonine protein kinase [Funiculus sociatus GB2-A5]|uniref:non-specific serine/threonine protein kinase n=1 Tax=Funiculus sociatus GB2-A5 TaxID=2933946 RepID=A0ABV0JTT0_9CYAN|nr:MULTISPECIES: serine/threonine-protein kinase [unclassified Trichocoleus]MBD1908948.1 protein kinase [Trichocoleus sp. FACHB-832]MBD2062982.1 protein kinase [Trichocoleus sp. FACHB-6]
MSNSSHTLSRRPRYQTLRELGRNRAGGRITYLAKDNVTEQLVILKRFLFAQVGSEWSGFKAYEREIQVLRGLDHPGIPRYLDSFETPSGFCMVQEYKDALPLSAPRSFDPDDIQKIAVSVLEILIYLQNRIPSVIHRDIKPENILVDEQLNVYLVDFGLARIGSGEMAMSSVAAGTFGFMAPEQIYNRQLNEATDLYGLGATLICLLTGTKSTAIDTLFDEDGRLNFKPLLPKLSLRFVDWLSKMVEPKAKDRFPNATAALEALKPIYVNRLPEVKFSQLALELKTTQLGEKLTKTVSVNNSVPDTLLEGTWEVAPHESDPRYSNSHAWISFEPSVFKSNHADCKITVNTNKLMADKTYSRQILLHTNCSPETYPLTITVRTTLLETPKPPYISMVLLLVIALAMTGFWTGAIAWMVAVLFKFASWPSVAIFQLGVIAVFVAWFLAGTLLAAVGIRTVIGIKIAAWLTTLTMLVVLLSSGFLPAAIAALGTLAGLVIGFVNGAVIKNYKERGFTEKIAVSSALLITGLGMSLGTGFSVGFLNFFLFSSLLGTSLSLVAMMYYPYQQREKLMAEYRHAARNRRLIKP